MKKQQAATGKAAAKNKAEGDCISRRQQDKRQRDHIAERFAVQGHLRPAQARRPQRPTPLSQTIAAHSSTAQSSTNSYSRGEPATFPVNGVIQKDGPKHCNL